MKGAGFVSNLYRASRVGLTSIRPSPCSICLDLAQQRRRYAGAAAVVARPAWQGTGDKEPPAPDKLAPSGKGKGSKKRRKSKGSVEEVRAAKDEKVGSATGSGHDDAASAPAAPNPVSPIPVASGTGEAVAPTEQDDADEMLDAELDALAEGHRARFSSAASPKKAAAIDMPGAADVEALRPPRMKTFVVGMSRAFYTDRYDKAVLRLTRAFTNSQLRYLLEEVLGYSKKAVPTLTRAGFHRVAQLKAKGDHRTSKELAFAVMAGASRFRRSSTSPLGKQLDRVSKREMCEWIASAHWELPHPASLPDQPTMAQRAASQLIEAEMYKMPYPELFLVQQQEGESGGLSKTAQELGVAFEFSSEGILIRGPAIDRVAFQRQIARRRKTIVSRPLEVPDGLVGAAVTPELLRSLGSVAGGYIESSPEGLKGYAYNDDQLGRLEQALLQLATTRSITSSIPLMLAPTSSSTPNTPALCLLPSVPRYRPAWSVASVASSYGRFTYAKRLASMENAASELPISLESPQLACVRGDVSDVLQWLLDVPSHEQLGDLRLRATFGHLIYPRGDAAAAFGPQFSGEDAVVQLALWNQSVEPPPFFAPGPLYPDLAPPMLGSSHEQSALLETEGRSVHADEARQVHVFSPAASKDGAHDRRALESFRVSMPKKETRIQRVVQRRAILMLPEHPLDVMFTAERRSKDDASDPTDGAYTKGATSFVFNGQQYVRTEVYTSQRVRWSSATALPPGISLRHERRRDMRLASPAPDLRGELLATAGEVSIGDFLNTALRLASESINTHRNQ